MNLTRGTIITGLSPRVRGNPRSLLISISSSRSIPARAGEPDLICPMRCPSKVYPRACGGTEPGQVIELDSAGLSPRVRGNPPRPEGGRSCRGSIPARAGEPEMAAAHHPLLKVYPRACGGTQPKAGRNHQAGGLSPRVRGNRGHRVHPLPGGGSIPARAGEPLRGRPWPSRREVYPRACGGTTAKTHLETAVMGLSPRVRGNRCGAVHRDQCCGSIPARAGEPPSSISRLASPTVYPRACGGTSHMILGSCRSLGLSPRVRGNRLVVGQDHDDPGSIPARAGEP